MYLLQKKRAQTITPLALRFWLYPWTTTHHPLFAAHPSRCVSRQASRNLYDLSFHIHPPWCLLPRPCYEFRTSFASKGGGCASPKGVARFEAYVTGWGNVTRSLAAALGILAAALSRKWTSILEVDTPRGSGGCVDLRPSSSLPQDTVIRALTNLAKSNVNYHRWQSSCITCVPVDCDRI